ncbi:MAG: biotin--[acetyl-CoA-carboxylase] ligase [Eubacteriales bacterium]|nr:biotin--[acetyl-CoA-carboxylase] ligase [Eubacteriales bacterium]
MSEIRDKILHMLQEERGEFLSGQAISERLGVSRTAVWKHMQALQKSGAKIDAVTNCGYRLLAEPAPPIEEALPALCRTAALGKQVQYFRQTDSTNRQAKRFAREGASHGLAVIAEEQTEGRGRRGRGWVSVPFENLYVSLLLRPNLETAKAPRFTIATALGVYRLLQGYGIPASIKWPNDILVNGKKLCGILLEMEGTLEDLEAVIVGIGLNVNSTVFPEELISTASSMRLESGSVYDRTKVLSRLLEALEPLYAACESDIAYEALLCDYRRVCGTIGRQVNVIGITDTRTGTVEDVDELGRLLLRTADGTLHTVSAGDVSVR